MRGITFHEAATFVVQRTIVGIVPELLVRPSELECAQSIDAVRDVVDALEHAVLQPENGIELVVLIGPLNFQRVDDVFLDLDSLQEHLGLLFEYQWPVEIVKSYVSQVDA